MVAYNTHTTHNKNKTQFKTVILLGCLEGNMSRGGCRAAGSRWAGRQAGREWNSLGSDCL